LVVVFTYPFCYTDSIVVLKNIRNYFERGKTMKQRLALMALIVLTTACASPTPTATPTALLPTASPTPTETPEPEFIEVTLTFVNNSALPLDFFWVNNDSREENFGRLDPGGTSELTSYFEQIWNIP
jgi:hypothetical protein